MVLRNVLEVAVESGVLYTNPARGVKRAKVRARELTLPGRRQVMQFAAKIRSAGGRDSKNCADFEDYEQDKK